MNITEALPAMNPQSLPEESKQNQASGSLDALLFSLFLNNYLQERHGAGQVAGESGERKNIFISSIPENDIFDSIPEPESFASIPAQSSYLQILQNLFPAGKEANSGLGAEQSPIDSFLTIPGLSGERKDLISAGNTLNRFDSGQLQPRPEQSFNRFEMPSTRANADRQSSLERVGSNTVSPGQHNFLQAQELARNIQIGKQLSELAGRIEITPRSSKKPTESVLHRNNSDFILWLQQSQAQAVQAKTERSQVAQMLNDLNRIQPDNQASANEQLKQDAASGAANNDYGKTTKTLQQGVLPNGQTLYDVTSPASTLLDPKTTEKTSPEAMRVMEQVLEVLQKQDLKPLKEVKELTIQLQPAELGKVNISLKMENGSLNLVINTSEQTTGMLLQNSIQDLKDSLAQIGVTCGSFEMNYQSEGQQGTWAQFTEQYTENRIYNEDYDSDLTETEMFSQLSLNSYAGYNNSGYRINIRA